MLHSIRACVILGSGALPDQVSALLDAAGCWLHPEHPGLCPGGMASHILCEKVWADPK